MLGSMVVKLLFQVHKAHVGWLVKLPHTLKYLQENKELVDSITRMKTALFLLNAGFDFPHQCLESLCQVYVCSWGVWSLYCWNTTSDSPSWTEGTPPVCHVIAKLQRYVHENGIKILKEPRDKRKTKDQIRSNLTWKNCRFCTWIWINSYYKIMPI